MFTVIDNPKPNIKPTNNNYLTIIYFNDVIYKINSFEL